MKNRVFVNDEALKDQWYSFDPTIEEFAEACSVLASFQTMQNIITAIRRIDPTKKEKQIFIHFRSLVHSLHLTDDAANIIGGMTGTTEIYLMEDQFLHDTENEFSLRLPDFDIFIYGDHLSSTKKTQTFDRAKTMRQIETLTAQLANPSFTEKAPKNVVDAARENLKKMQAMLTDEAK